MQPLLGAHGIDLVGGHAVGEHGIEVERGADGLRGGGTVAGDHDDARDAAPRAACRIACGVSARSSSAKQQRADRPALDRDKDDQRRPPRGAADGARRPIVDVLGGQRSGRANPR